MYHSDPLLGQMRDSKPGGITPAGKDIPSSSISRTIGTIEALMATGMPGGCQIFSDEFGTAAASADDHEAGLFCNSLRQTIRNVLSGVSDSQWKKLSSGTTQTKF